MNASAVSRPLLLTIAVALVALAMVGCRKSPVSERAASIRLIERLGDAEMRTPLADTPPLASLVTDLEAFSPQVLWQLEPAFHDGVSLSGCRAGDSAFRCESGGASGTAAFRLLAQLLPVPLAPTAIAFEVRTSNSGCAFLQLSDQDEIRRIPLVAAENDWTERRLIWPSRERPSPLKFLVTGRRLAEPCTVELRSATAHGLREATAIETALLRERDRLPGALDDHGIAKFGVFLPVGDVETVVPPFDENHGARELLLAVAPTELSFELRVPSRSRLLFSYALSRESRLGDQVDFEVLVRRTDQPASGLRHLWRRRLVLNEENWHWHEASVALDELWQAPVELVLRTSSPGRGLALWGTPTVDVPRQSADPPNVVLIAVDTLRADRLAAYGYPVANSERIGELARDGVLFGHAVSQSNWTVPSFASIFTGQIVPRHRLTTLEGSLASTISTLPRSFRDHGYRTEAILYKPALHHRLDDGFERYFNIPRRNHRASQNLEKALQWLERAHDQKFFLFLHFNDPHQPFTQPGDFVSTESRATLDQFGLDLPLQVPQDLESCSKCGEATMPVREIRSLARDLYDQEIRYFDGVLGRFLDELRRRGLYDDSVIAFVSDHGETLWDHYGYYGHGGANQHSELTHVPLVIKPAGDRFRRGVAESRRVGAFDLMPTLLELAGIDFDAADLDARSLTRYLGSSGLRSAEDDRLIFTQSAASAAFLLDRWKYVVPVGRGNDPGKIDAPVLAAEQLFDLLEDPGETENLAMVSPVDLGKVRARAFEYLLRSVGGDFLMVRSQLEMRQLSVRCVPVCIWDPLLQFGQERLSRQDAPGVDLFEGSGLLGGMTLFARLHASGDTEIRISTSAPDIPAITSPRVLHLGTGDELLELLTRRDTNGAWILRAPSRLREEEENQSAALVDPQQEEALRALGYIQ